MGALSFTTPLILAALALLPAIWFLLRATPPSPSVERFPAFFLLQRLSDKKQTPERTPLWLLILRIVLAALIIFALAGPILNAPQKTESNNPILLVLDDTATAAHHWRTRENAMLTAAKTAEQEKRDLYLVTTADPGDEAPQLMTGAQAKKRIEALAPSAFPADRTAALAQINMLSEAGPFDILWLSDGRAGDDDDAFAQNLDALGDLTVFIDRKAQKPALLPTIAGSDGAPRFRIERLSSESDWDGELVALATDGRELLRIGVQIPDGESAIDVGVTLPLALRNQVASIRIENAQSASAVQLVDARDRRALVGVISETSARADKLLSGAHYIREALENQAELFEGSISEALDAGVSVIILDDIGAIRPSNLDALNAWIEKGGVLIRFSGAILAEAAQDRTPPLLPVELRGGGRAFGGALTWDTPQSLDEFPADSPFAGLTPPTDAKIRRQILAEPGGETTRRSWARLKDGTPLVTGARQGNGVIALFHITATPQWSDLPISGLFVDMLGRIIQLSALGPNTAHSEQLNTYPPLRLLDGYGRLQRPADTAPALTREELAGAASSTHRPGLYGYANAPLALNVMQEETPYAPLSVRGVNTEPYEEAPPRELAPPIFALALLLLIADIAAAMAMSGGLRFARTSTTATVATLAIAAALLTPNPGYAQDPLDPPIDATTMDATLTTRLAFVQTGDPALDRLSMQAMNGLSRELYRRTALEPGRPIGIDPEADDLSVFPFLYWPITPDADAPSEAALANIENFLRFGGMILFDTRDDERAVGALSTPEGLALQRTLSQLNIPPLMPVDSEHVLSRSFYLLPGGLDGRNNRNSVWVAADASGANDGVTPIIIGGRDWAGAWAVDQFGRPLRPMPAGNPRAREMAYRAGINMVMVAFTGNYKSDQVHTPILLERLGR